MATMHVGAQRVEMVRPAGLGILTNGVGSRLRLVRFAVTGGVCSGLQLVLLYTLELLGWNPTAANAVGYLVSAQLNFVLSSWFIWGDRREGGPGRLEIARRWVSFHGSIAGTAVLNLVVFAAARSTTGSLTAGVLGIAVSAVLNYLVQDRLVFGRRRGAGDTMQAREAVTETEADLTPDAQTPSHQTHAAGLPDEPVLGSAPLWARLALVGVAVLAAVLYAWRLTAAGYANEYYSAAVLSMTQSLHNFFYFALDPGGFITPDKPPFAFWVQALSARIFGFSPASMLAPQAVSGVATVLVVHHLVRRVWGDAAALLSALVVTLTPITVATTRDNLPDAILVLLMTLGAWGFLNALRTPRLRPLLVAAAMVGLAFNTKMLQAYLVVPAGVLVYFATSSVPLRRRIGYLLAAAALLFAVSGAWMAAVDLTPADQRPYVGGSTNNSVLNLVMGYNGLGRVFGQGGPGAGGVPAGGDGAVGNAEAGADGGRDGGGGVGAGGFGGGFGGQAGWLRMFNAQVGTQVSWLLVLAAAGLAAGVAARLGRPRSDEARADLLFWGGWLGTHFVVFSLAAGIFHPYYTIAMGPAIGALVGPGVVSLWRWYQRGRVYTLALPVALVATAGWALVLFSRSGWGQPYLTWAVVGMTAASLAGLLGGRLLVGRAGWVPAAGLALGLAAVLVGPGVWSVNATATGGVMSVNPLAGPQSGAAPGGPGGVGPGAGFAPGQDGPRVRGGGAGGDAPGGAPPAGPVGNDNERPFPGRQGGAAPQPGDGPNGLARPGDGGPFGPGGRANPALVAYLQANLGSAKYLVAVNSANAAAPIILATGQPVMAMGGFNGSDPAPTAEQLRAMVQRGEVRFIQTGGFGGPGGGRSDRTAWVSTACTVVDAAAYGGAGGGTLYDCGALAAKG